MDRRLGRPLPSQLANPTRVHLIPPEFFTPYHAVLCAYAVLAAISNCYPPVWGRLPTRYSPVRHSVTKDFIRRICLKCFVRLACVKHAASVHPEPGSNSLNKCVHQEFHVLALMKIVRSSSRTCSARFAPGQNQLLANLSLLLFLRIFRSFVFMILKRTFEECVSLFSYQRSVLHCRLSQTALLLYHVVSCLSRTFFNFFWSCFCFSLAATLISYHIQPAVVKNFFHFFLTALWSLWDLSDATLIGYHRCLDLSILFLIFLIIYLFMFFTIFLTLDWLTSTSFRK